MSDGRELLVERLILAATIAVASENAVREALTRFLAPGPATVRVNSRFAFSD